MASYARPSSIEETLSLLKRDSWRIVAGGTDFYPMQGDKPIRENVLDVSDLRDLREISVEGDHWRIGGLASWTDVIHHDLPRAFDGLKLAAREVGSIQIQNAGTVAGNLCNASPAADSVPPLLTLDASVELSSQDGRRTLPLGEFITGVRRTAMRPDEIVSAVLIPRAGDDAPGHFIKLGARVYLVISIVMVAAIVEPAGDGTVSRARVAVGSCSPVAQRLPALEAALAGVPFEAAALAEIVRPEHFSVLSPSTMCAHRPATGSRRRRR
ncbi:FAD binding domain-containing protein [Kaustia mangrovi]|uniref:FAD binding domain-containing protein n=1 Tax=Kaustia mangrovi TaxID=2593653 RepID=UPI001FE2F633|nr:FAD binding domain-containing protein [Kaustia mangrovi]